MNNLIKVAAAFVLVAFFSCKGNQNSSQNSTSDSTAVVADTAAHSSTVYTCPMHPEVVKTDPGNCPKCGMKLVEKQ